MIFNVKNTAGKKVKVYAYPGLQIKAATKYNTRTREIEMFLLGETDNGQKRVLTVPDKVTKRNQLFPRKTLKVKVKIPGSFILVNGKKY